MDFGLGSVLSAGFGGIAGLGQSIINKWSQDQTNKVNKQIAEQNLNYQREANALNLALTREQWARDDNAISRRVADLTANGLSKTLASGNGASNSSPISVKSLHNDYKQVNNPLDVLNALQMSQEFATNSLNNKLLREQIKYQKEANRREKLVNDYIDENDALPPTDPSNSDNLTSKDKWNLGFRLLDSLLDVGKYSIATYGAYRYFKDKGPKPPTPPSTPGPGRFKMIRVDEGFNPVYDKFASVRSNREGKPLPSSKYNKVFKTNDFFRENILVPFFNGVKNAGRYIPAMFSPFGFGSPVVLF